MSFPNPNLPKPPPKAPPRAAPGGPPGKPGLPAPAGAQARPAGVPAPPRPGGAARPTASATPANAPATGFTTRQGGESAPPIQIDIRGLNPVLTPMVEAIRDYDALLVEENNFLRVCDAKGVASLAARKQQMTKTYQERLRALLGNAGMMTGVPKEQRETVMRLIRCLEARCHENATLLKANMEAANRVFEVMNSAVIDARKRDAFYNKSGGFHFGYNAAAAYNATV